MKINVFKVVLVVVFVILAGYNVYAQQKAEMSDLAMENVDALTSDKVNPMCPNGCVDKGNGCGCNGIYVNTWKEYNW